MNAPPLPEAGTTETRQAARAFNDMQARLRNLIENRTRLLAAISHDLRTPLTLLRLRAETVENAQERDKMLSTIAEMDSMIGATLEFARDESASEPRRQTDLTSLLQSVVDDMTRRGPSSTYAAGRRPSSTNASRPRSSGRSATCSTTPSNTERRAARNIRMAARAIEIDIDDEGPGIPEPELSRVLEPFYRLEESRSRETGGVGLGLAITHSIVQAHGGTLELSNRPTGGLRASIVLPR